MTIRRSARSRSSRTCRVAIACSVCLLLASGAAGGEPAQGGIAGRLSLEAAVRMAIESNRRVQSARLQIEKAETNVAIARTRRLPIFESEASASQLLSPVDFAFPRGAFGDFPATGPIPGTDTTISVPRQPTFYLSSQVSQPLTQLFQIGLGIRSAAAARDVEHERARAEQLSVVNSVKRLYFAILQTQSALTATDEAITLYRELNRTLDVRATQKVVLRSDVLDVEFRLAQEELTRTTRVNTLASQKEQLNQLLGRDVRTPFDVDDIATVAAIEVDITAAQSRALESRPDVREARLRLQQAELDRRITRADSIPDVSLAASYTSNFNIDVLPRNLATVGVRVTWEPFDWGRTKQEQAGKARSVQQAHLAVRDAEDRTVLEINSRFRTLSEMRARLGVARMAQTATREKLRVRTNQYQVQAALLPDVLQVRAELADMDDRYQHALMDFWTAKADYDLAVGEDVLQ
jgi:outer membrane protein